jgi:hypothetical protein
MKDVYAATVAGRQINLGWQNVSERRTEGPDIGDKWSGGIP